MSDSSDLRKSADELVATVKRLGDVVEAQGESASTLAEQVIESNERAARDAKVLRILVGFMVFKVIMLFLLFVAIQRVNDTNAAIKDCTNPTGECAQRGARQTVGAILGIEAERLRTEIELAKIRGDQVSVDYREKRLAEIEQRIKEIREADGIPAPEN
jgi:hypothetical protein